MTQAGRQAGSRLSSASSGFSVEGEIAELPAVPLFLFFFSFFVPQLSEQQEPLYCLGGFFFQ